MDNAVAFEISYACVPEVSASSFFVEILVDHRRRVALNEFSFRTFLDTVQVGSAGSSSLESASEIRYFSSSSSSSPSPYQILTQKSKIFFVIFTVSLWVWNGSSLRAAFHLRVSLLFFSSVPAIYGAVIAHCSRAFFFVMFLIALSRTVAPL